MLQNFIPTRLKSALTKRPPGLGKDWRKRALILVGFVLALFVIGHLGVRYIIWPQIEKSKASVERVISARTGVNVTIGDLRVSWTGIRPAFEMDDLRFRSPDESKSLLAVEKIYGQLSWKSFYHLEPYFHEIHFENAQIYTQRNSRGVIAVAGIPIDKGSSDYSAENWLFSQDSIDAKQITLFWDDQLNKKPITSAQIINLSLDSGIRRHDGSLTATTPWTQGPIELKVNFVPHLGGQAGNWRDWIGTLSWNLNALDLKQISKEFKLNLSTLEGVLSSTGNLKIDNAQADGGEFFITADNLIVQSSKNEEAITFGRLETNLLQETTDGLISLSSKTFAWRDIDSPKSAPLENLSPMTFRWRPPGDDGEIKEFGFSSPKIAVEDIALFALNLPLSKKVQQWIKASKAEGELENLDLHWSENKSALSALNIPGNWFNSNKLDFTISAKLNNLSFVGINKSIPSVSNLSGFLSGNQKEGSFSLDSNQLGLEVQDFLEDPKIQLDSAAGQITWAKQKGHWVIDAKKVSLSNPEITTSLSLNYILGNGKEPDLMALDMSFEKANVKTAYRYLPVSMGKEVRTYLSKAFESGSIQNGHLHINGDPNLAPFPDKTQGELSLSLPVVASSFSPVPELPRNQGTWGTFTNVNGNINMTNSKFSVDVSSANYKQIALDTFHAEIPNVSAKQLTLTVNGNAKGQAPLLLEYFYNSPAGKNEDEIQKNLKVTGPIDLNLGLKIPLSGVGDTAVDLKLALPGNKAQWATIPPFENLRGNIRITESNPEFENVSAEFLGGNIKINSIDKGEQKRNFGITGEVRSNFIKEYFANTASGHLSAMLKAMSGSIKYDGNISFNGSGSDSNLKFDLRDWALNAPAPAKKLAGTPLMANLNIKTFAIDKNNNNRLTWTGKLGDLYATQGSISRDNVVRSSLGIGATPTLPQQGFALNLQANELNIDAWEEFLANKKNTSPQNADASTENIQINAQVKKLTMLDRIWPDVNVQAANKINAWDIRINSPQAAGQVQFHEANNRHPNSLLSGHFTKLKVPEEITESSNGNGNSNKNPISPNSIPSLDIAVDDLSFTKAHLGQVKVKTQSSNNTLTLDLLQINNPQGFSTFKGQWFGGNKNDPEHSSLTADMDIKDAGQIIAHWTPQKSIEGGQGKVLANAQWDGPIYSPKYESLSGKASISLEKGRLLDVNSDGAKLLDVLSLQSLFKFATLDLQGSLGGLAIKGTPFNTIYSNFDITNGIAKTEQFNMILDQARVVMSGQINLPNQTQDLRITIFPTIDATAGSLAAFAINPIVGLSALVGQFLLTSQINRGMQSDYLVQGSWNDPEVIVLDQKGQPVDTKALNSIRSKDLLIEQNRPPRRDIPQNNSSNSTNPTN